jgi:hypothetical protein
MSRYKIFRNATSLLHLLPEPTLLLAENAQNQAPGKLTPESRAWLTEQAQCVAGV